jgi:hypothetical protein
MFLSLGSVSITPFQRVDPAAIFEVSTAVIIKRQELQFGMRKFWR